MNNLTNNQKSVIGLAALTAIILFIAYLMPFNELLTVGISMNDLYDTDLIGGLAPILMVLIAIIPSITFILKVFFKEAYKKSHPIALGIIQVGLIVWILYLYTEGFNSGNLELVSTGYYLFIVSIITSIGTTVFSFLADKE